MSEQFDFEGTVAKIKSIQQSNQDKVTALNASGKSIDAGVLANIKIDTFIQMFLDKQAQAAYALAMETNFAEALDEGLKQIRQAQILQGVHSSGLTIPKG